MFYLISDEDLEQPLQCIPNYDLKNIHTVMDGNKFAQLLNEAGYDPKEIEFIHNGFTRGFPLEYHGPKNRRLKSCNMPLRCGSKVQLWNKMIKEVNLKRFAGPFKSVPFKYFVQSPAGLVPKHDPDENDSPGSKNGNQENNSSKYKNQATHLIFNLSWRKGTSINDYTPCELCTFKYKDLDKAVQMCLEVLGSEQNKQHKCFLAKTDIKSAFRHLPIRPEDWCWLVLMARHPVTNKKYYFADKLTPFGSSVSCRHSQRVSNGLEAVFWHRTNHKSNNYLGDFLFASFIQQLCNDLVREFIQICIEIKLPISEDKTEWVTEFIIFLGMLLNTRDRLILIPLEKKIKAVSALNGL